MGFHLLRASCTIRAGDMVEKPFINTVRWVSAAIVMIGHAAGWAMNLDRPVDLPTAVIRYLLDLGHGAVIIFFVVSGYLVGGSILAARGRFSWRRYVVARFTRIYIVVIPALLLTVGLDGWVHLIHPHNPIYAKPWGRITESVFSSYTPQHLLAAIASLESIVGPPIGSNKPLWSLGYEWVFYFVLPTVLMLGRRFKPGPNSRLALAAALALVMVALHQRWMATYWLIWLAGAAASQVRAPGILAWMGGCAGVSAFLISPFFDQRLTDPVEGLGLALLFAWPPLMRIGISPGLDKRLADISFSLYATHMPVLTFAVFVGWWSGWFPLARLPFGASGGACWILLCGLALLVAVLFGMLFERWTTQARALFMHEQPRKPSTSVGSVVPSTPPA